MDTDLISKHIFLTCSFRIHLTVARNKLSTKWFLYFHYISYESKVLQSTKVNPRLLKFYYSSTDIKISVLDAAFDTLEAKRKAIEEKLSSDIIYNGNG